MDSQPPPGTQRPLSSSSASWSGRAEELPPEVREAAARRERWLGRYVILRELGRGGMGVVYAAYDPSLKRHVAIKMILDPAHAGPAAIARFRREAAAAGALRHPNVVAVFEVGEHQGKPFLVLELVNGPSFEKALAANTLDERQRVAIVRDVARALGAAHERGIIHRDVKPENVLIDPTGAPRLMDFGLARQVDEVEKLTATGAIMGTPAYMAPEQAEGERARIGPWTDVYALGAMLFRAITGKAPFESDSIQGLLKKVMFEDASSVKTHRPDAPDDLDTIALKCLAKDPQARYANATEVADELQRWLDGAPIHARPLGSVGRARRWAGRHRALVVGVGVTGTIALVALTLLVHSLVTTGRATRRREEARVHLRRAIELMSQEQSEPARKAADEALAIDPTFPEAWVTRGDASGKLKEWDAAIAAYDEALALDPKAANVVIARGSVQRRAGRATEALADFDRAIALAPELASAWAHRASLHAERREWKRAEEDATHSIELAPTVADNYELRASARMELGNLAGANADATKAISLGQKLDGALLRAEVALRLNDLAGCEMDATTALKERGTAAKHRRARLLRGQARVLARNYDGAIEDATKVLEKVQESMAYVIRARARYEKRDFPGTIEDATRALELAPGDEHALHFRAQSYAQTGDWASSRKDLDVLVAKDPKSAQYWALRAQARRGLADADGAIEDANRALALDPNDLRALVSRGVALAEKDDPAALPDLERILSDFADQIGEPERASVRALIAKVKR